MQKLLNLESDKVNVNINLAMLKLLKQLPGEIMESQLPSFIHCISNFLKSRLESIRDEARISSPVALSLLKAIIQRKFAAHEICDVVTQVQESMVTSQVEPIPVKSLCLIQINYLYRSSKFAKDMPGRLYLLAQEISESLRSTFGIENNVRVHAQTRKEFNDERDNTKRDEKLMAVVDPARNTKRKLRIAAKNCANKRRKIMSMKMQRGGCASSKGMRRKKPGKIPTCGLPGFILTGLYFGRRGIHS
ncbi:hypothetical protein CDL15_Pgr004119 [Punica granatum]|uniref:U3 small nucleolar RNA-associated protein 20 domain-containing protein n=1 Tax=Punica granatum TaxID=22663 RepID=A0A218XG78_PUNGR|nr:hypothetical protein CDL15_Pgr004119 [Punica granatum]